MRVYSLTMYNFMGYKGKHKRVFKDKDVIGIIAEFKDDKDASNQAGKTTIMEAIKYALTGISRAKKDSELIHYGQEVMYVELVLIEDGVKYTVNRGRDHKNKGSLTLDWIEKSPEAQKEIEALIGFSAKEFELITYFKQTEINKFMEMDNAKKKDFIIKWFKSEHWGELESAVKDDMSLVRDEFKKISAKIEALEETFDNEIDLETELEVEQEELDKVVKLITSAKKKLDKLQKSNNTSEDDYLRAKSNIKKYKAKIEDIESIIEDNDKYSALSDKFSSKARAVKSKIEMGIDTAHKGVARCTSEFERLEAKVRLAEKHKTGICPVLSESCDRIKFDAKSVSNWKKNIIGLKENRDEYKSQIELSFEASELEDKANKYHNKIKKGEFHGEIEDAKEIIKHARSVVKSWDSTINDKIDEAESRLEKLQEEKSELQNSVTRTEEKIKARENNESSIKKYKKKLKKLAIKIDDLNYLIMMFGKNGIPSLEIENGFHVLEDEANFSLQEMNPDMEMTMKPTTLTSTKEPLCLECGWQYPKGTRSSDCGSCGAPRKYKTKDEMVFNITKNGESYKHYMDSGGGKAIISIALRTALTQMKRRMDNARLNVIFLDEPDSSLDKRYLNKFVKLVATTLTKKLGVEQVFWISHNKEIQNSLPHTLKVIKDGHEAKTRWV